MVKKYKQTEIPSVSTKDVKLNPKKIAEYYKNNLENDFVINKALGIKILFTKTGRNKIAFGSSRHKQKIAVLSKLKKILRVAEYNNFGQRKDKDAKNVVGYLNFKAKVFIDGKLETLRIAVTMTKDYKFYYNHEVNIKKQTPPSEFPTLK